MFTNKQKGHSLEGIIKIALGDKGEGLEVLQAYNQEQRQNIVAVDPSENLRRKNARRLAKEIYEEVSLQKDLFFQNQEIAGGHGDNIDFVQVTGRGDRFLTTSRRLVKIWQLRPEIKHLKTLELQSNGQDEQECSGYGKVVASLDEEGSTLVVYRHGEGSVSYSVKFYHLDKIEEHFSGSNVIREEALAGDETFVELCWLDQDETEEFAQEIASDHDFDVIDVRFRRDPRQGKESKQASQFVRMYVIHNKMSFTLDIDPANLTVPKYSKSNLYWDKSIFRDARQKHFERSALEDFLQGFDGCAFAFAEEEVYTICVLDPPDAYEDQSRNTRHRGGSTEKGTDRYFRIYDVLNKRFVRKIKRAYPSLNRADSYERDDGDAFDLDFRANVLVYATRDQIKFKSIRLPDLIAKHMAPKFQMAEYKYSPARIQEQKHAMKEKITRDLKNYDELGGSSEYSSLATRKQKILKLLTFKYNQMCLNKRIIQANHEFLNMARVILREPQPDCPITGIDRIIILQTFTSEELMQQGEQKEVRFMQLASEVNMTFVFVAIGRKVYKYDLVSKECLFEFKTYARQAL